MPLPAALVPVALAAITSLVRFRDRADEILALQRATGGLPFALPPPPPDAFAVKAELLAFFASPAGEADEGALYLATTAPIFREWAGTSGAEARDETGARRAAGREVIGSFLSETERKAAPDLTAAAAAVPSRLRHLEWYRRLEAP